MMDWVRLYSQMNQTESMLFKRLVNLLLSKTFLLRDDYDLKEGRLRVHPDYRFVERHIEIFSGYLDLGGWTLHRDNSYGVIYLNSSHDYNRFQFNKFQTLVLFTLRIIFEERREEVQIRNEVIVETNELVQKMIVLGILDKKPAMKELGDTLRLMSGFNLVNRIEGGKWEAPETRLMILPSILFVIPNEKISLLNDLTETQEQTEENDSDLEYEDDSDMMEDVL